MDSMTFVRLVESCEDAILARLADFGGGASGASAFAGEPRAALCALLGFLMGGEVVDTGPDREPGACLAAARYFFAEAGFTIEEMPNPFPPGPNVFLLRCKNGCCQAVHSEDQLIEQGRAILAAAGRVL